MKRMGELSDILPNAGKIKPQGYRFDEATLRDIERFKQEFKGKKLEMEQAIRQLEAKYHLIIMHLWQHGLLNI